ncbi:MAG: hypothetical protein GF331_10830 [Chitinivibrionales bacterium]|nr:hypothetical protein [Chitinivibrionales bacterium]
MSYRIVIEKSVVKRLRRLPKRVQERFNELAYVLRTSGPTGPHLFANYSKLGEEEYHCHLG